MRGHLLHNEHILNYDIIYVATDQCVNDDNDDVDADNDKIYARNIYFMQFHIWYRQPILFIIKVFC